MRPVVRVGLGLLTAATMVACKRPPPSASADGGPAAPPPNVVSTSAMSVTPVPRSSVEKLVNPDALPAYKGPVGSIEGTVFVTGPEAPDATDPKTGQPFTYRKCPAAKATRAKSFRTGPSDAEGRRPLVGAVLAVTGYTNAFVPEQEEAKHVDVADCADFPRTITMTFGQRLEIANKTKDVFAPQFDAPGQGALMVAPPGADAVKLYPPHPGFFQLVERLGDDAIAADVYVLLHPLHTTSGVDGRYRIDHVPVGALKIGVRLAAVGELVVDVDIKDGVVTRRDLVLPYVPRPKEFGTMSDAGTSRTADAGANRVIH
ncbi:MAG: hypothetical protein U0169_19990 [Polyangiaceae bacterium]